MSNARNLANLLGAGNSISVDGSITAGSELVGNLSGRILMDASASGTDVGDEFLLNATDGSASNDGSKILFEEGTDDPNTLLSADLTFVNSHYWVGTKAADQTLARVTLTTITGMTADEKDSHSAFDGTTFTVPSGGAGLYYIFGTIYYDWGSSGNDGEDNQTLIVHTPSGGSAATIATGRFNTGATRPVFDTTQTAAVIFQLGVGDTVIMRAYGADNNGGGGGVALADQTNFGGFKIAGV